MPKDATVVTCINDENWFWCIIELTPEQSTEFKDVIQSSTNWPAMPLTENLIEAAEFLQPNTSEFKASIPITNSNGFYTFLDLEAEYAAKHPYAGSSDRIKQPFHKRGGLNYVFGYFDDIERRVYVWWSHT